MVLAIEGIDRISKDPFIYKYIEDAFGGIDTLKKSTIPLLFSPLKSIKGWELTCVCSDISRFL